MDLFAFPPIAATLDAAYAVLMAIIGLLDPITGAASAAAAVILLTLLVRAILVPVGVAQAKGEQTRARIAPKLQALQRRYKNDRERLQRETMRLYADEKASPFAGCVPVLIQAPIVGVIYALFLHTVIAGHSNALLTQQLFDVTLGASLAGALGDGSLTLGGAVVFGILIAAIAGIAEATRRLLRPESTTAPTSLPPEGAMRLIGLLHFATAIVAIFVPLAAGLYLVITVAWTLVQRVILRRMYPLDPPAVDRSVP